MLHWILTYMFMGSAIAQRSKMEEEQNGTISIIKLMKKCVARIPFHTFLIQNHKKYCA